MLKKLFIAIAVIMAIAFTAVTTAYASDGSPINTINWTQWMIAATGLVLTGVIIPLINAVLTWLKSKIKNETLHTAFNEAREVACTVVSSLQQTVVNDIKEKTVNGKLTDEQAKEIAHTAINMFLSDLSEKSLKVLEDNADDVNAYIGRLIETQLLKLKSGII